MHLLRRSLVKVQIEIDQIYLLTRVTGLVICKFGSVRRAAHALHNRVKVGCWAKDVLYPSVRAVSVATFPRRGIPLLLLFFILAGFLFFLIIVPSALPLSILQGI